jgi:hypothetical protein
MVYSFDQSIPDVFRLRLRIRLRQSAISGCKAHRFQADRELAGFDARQIEHFVDQFQQMAAGMQDSCTLSA